MKNIKNKRLINIEAHVGDWVNKEFVSRGVIDPTIVLYEDGWFIGTFENDEGYKRIVLGAYIPGSCIDLYTFPRPEHLIEDPFKFTGTIDSEGYFQGDVYDITPLGYIEYGSSIIATKEIDYDESKISQIEEIFEKLSKEIRDPNKTFMIGIINKRKNITKNLEKIDKEVKLHVLKNNSN